MLGCDGEIPISSVLLDAFQSEEMRSSITILYFVLEGTLKLFAFAEDTHLECCLGRVDWILKTCKASVPEDSIACTTGGSASVSYVVLL